jgi:hypothetical protein
LLGPITRAESQRLDELMGAGPHVEEQDGKLYLLRDARGRCRFLGDDERCGVHARHGAEAKPATCRAFPIELVPTILGVRVVDRGTCASFPVSARAGLPLLDQLPPIEPGPRFHPAVHLGEVTIDYLYWLHVTDAAIERLRGEPAGQVLRWLGHVTETLATELSRCPIDPAEPTRTLRRIMEMNVHFSNSEGAGGEVATLVLDELAETAREAEVFGPLGAEIAATLGEVSRSLLEDPPGSKMDADALRASLQQQLFGRRSLVAERVRPALLRIGLLALCAARAPRGHEHFLRLLELGAAQSVLLHHDDLAAPILEAAPDLLAEPA